MELAELSLLDLVPALSPEYGQPLHLSEWCDMIERCLTEPVRGLCAVPIRHYKTETTLHGIVWLLLRDPTLRIILLTHSHTRAEALGKRLRQLAKAAGVGAERGWDTIVEWRNARGGGVVVMSADQSKLGYDCHVLVFDDPLDEQSADDPKIRESVDATIAHYTARCMRRGRSGSVLGVMSRWHPDDPIGRRLTRQAVKWEYVHHAAIEDEGTPHEHAFAEDVWSLEGLRKMRAEWAEKDPTERGWWAQLQNNPRPMGSDLFGPATRYTTLPTFGYRLAMGADFAFTEGAHADWFALTVARIYGHKAYILEVTREKIDAVKIESACKAALQKHGRAPIFSYQSGPEIGMTSVLRERGVPIVRMPARYNKLVRAQRTVKRWNDGYVLVPDDPAAFWVPGFLLRVSMFRGSDKADGDDEIDAMVSMCDGVMGGAVAGPSRIRGAAYSGL